MSASVPSERPGLVRRALDDIPNLLSLLAFFSATALLFRSWDFALIVTASLGFHELGHAALLAYHRLDWRISFGPAGAWTWSPLEGRERLSQYANTAIHLAGPAFSLLLALIAVGLHSWLQPGDQHLLLLANFSAQVGFLNLLPLGPLTDGGKAVRRVIASVEAPARAWAALLPMLISAAALVLYTFAQVQHLASRPSAAVILSLLLIGFWLASSLVIESRVHERSVAPDTGVPFAFVPVTGSPAGAQMTNFQALIVLFAIWDLLALGMVLINATPFWLAPQFLLGSLQNMLAVLHLLAQIPL